MNLKVSKIRRNVSILIFSTIISALSGFVRDILVAKSLGTTMQSDVYLSSNILSYTIFGIIGAAISTSFIPIFNEITQTENKTEAEAFSNKILTIIITLGIGLVILGEIFAPQITKVLFYGFEGEKYELAVLLQRIMLPLTLLTVLSNLILGILQSYGEFKSTAMVGLITNFVLIMYMLVCFRIFGVVGLCAANIIAYLIIILIQIIALKKSKYFFRYKLDLKDKRLRTTFSLVIPVIIGTSVGQMSDLINTAVSSSFNDGEMAALTYSIRIVAACMTVFITPFGTVFYPVMSKLSASLDYSELVLIIKKVINICCVLTIPLTVGFMVLSEPFIKFIFERGLFDEKATFLTMHAFFYYAIGLVGYSLRGFLEKAFYSLKDTKTPMMNGVIGITLNISLVLILTKYIGYIGIAIAYSIAGIFTSFLLLISLKIKLSDFKLKAEFFNIAKILIAAAVMGLCVYYIDGICIRYSTVLLFRLIINILSGCIIYALGCILLKVQIVLDTINVILSSINALLKKNSV